MGTPVGKLASIAHGIHSQSARSGASYTEGSELLRPPKEEDERDENAVYRKCRVAREFTVRQEDVSGSQTGRKPDAGKHQGCMHNDAGCFMANIASCTNVMGVWDSQTWPFVACWSHSNTFLAVHRVERMQSLQQLYTLFGLQSTS